MEDKKEPSGPSGDDIRVGVFVCDCGTNIAGVIDVPAVVEFARTLGGVVFAEEGKWICAVDYLSKLKEYITEYNLTRVVVACCTPRTHEPTFKATLKEAGLNPHLLEFVSIREQSSWVHKNTPELATEKAKDLVHMGVAKARLLEPGMELSVPVGKECMVIGGGIAGMTAALTLGHLGFKVLLVEKTESLGGLVNRLNIISPEDVQASKLIQHKIAAVQQHENISTFLNTEVTDVKGYIGNFTVKLEKKQAPDNSKNLEMPEVKINSDEHKVSTIIVATGMSEIEPIGKFGYGKFPNVLTLLQYEELLKNNNNKLSSVKDIAFINCVNSRNIERGCCNVGCLSAIKNIKMTKELNNDINAYLFFRDFNITGTDVQYHYESMDKYTAAFRYPDDTPPEVQSSDTQVPSGNLTSFEPSRLTVESFDILTGGRVKVGVDLLVLVTGYKGAPSADRLKGLLKVSVNDDGFFTEAHVKLRPLDFANDGIYICGCARSPKNVRETLEESIGAAMRAAIPMNRTFVETEGIVADIDTEACMNCALCSDACAFGAVEIVDNESKVIQAICKGCGTCAASCPREAISIIHYSDSQILAQVDAALSDKHEDKIIAFACHWCALGAVDNAGVSRFEYPSNIRLIRVMCSGRVDPRFILHAFQNGAAGVMVAGCEFPTCHYISGNYYTSKKMEFTKKLLSFAGIKPERLNLEWLSAAQGSKFAKLVTEFTRELETLGSVANDAFSKKALLSATYCADSERLRIIASKLKDFEETGNKYGEIFTKHELDRLLSDVVYDEFITQEILRLLNDSSSSVKMLANEMSISPVKIFKRIQDLQQAGQIELEGIEGKIPLYKVINGTPTVVSPEKHDLVSKPLNGTLPDPATNSGDFDYVISGTTADGLIKALDFANAGNKVCIISSNTSFLSNPPILNATFTEFSKLYNDYCNLTEQVFDHENITIFRNTTVEEVITENSSTHLKLLKKATYVNENKCDNCGICYDACPVKTIDFKANGLSNKHAIYQPWPETKSMKFAISKGLPYCQVSCPIKMDVRGYIGKLVDSDPEGAYNIIRRTNPLPDVCGKVCEHACESTCARAYKDEALEIRKLKRYATEYVYEEYEKAHEKKPLITKSKVFKNRAPENKVAIIGSGPAGLTAAHDLALLGYPVTIFEASSAPGGMLRLGIPDYRLPHSALEKELEAILELGVDLKLNTPLGPDLSIDDLRSQGFKAIFIAIGAHQSRRLGIEGEEINGVINGLEFLKNCNMDTSRNSKTIGTKIAVIGGGNVAFDCARTARRMGAEKVNILYRRTRSELPAAAEELEQCEAEGITIDYLVAPKRILGTDKVEALECQRNELGMPDTSGRRRPVLIEDSEFSLEVDNVITAIGQLPELSFLTKKDDFLMTRLSTFVVDNKTGATNFDGVFAGGDAVTGPATVVDAIQGGKCAARGIDEYLSGNPENNPNVYEFRGEKRTSELELLRLRKNKIQLQFEHDQEQPRKPKRFLEHERRLSTFDEVEEPYTTDEAIEEASRCLSCRICIGCGVCQAVCPQDAIDYEMADENLTVITQEVLYYPGLEESFAQDNVLLKELYRNSLNVVTPMELEYMLMPGSAYDGEILRPFDGEVPESIAFINLPEKEFVTDEQAKFNNLELEFMLRLMKYIQKAKPNIKITLFTNSMDLTEFPNGFQSLKDNLVSPEDLQECVNVVSSEAFKVSEVGESNSFTIENRGENENFTLVVVGVNLGLS